jgi:hypothetical protein
MPKSRNLKIVKTWEASAWRGGFFLQATFAAKPNRVASDAHREFQKAAATVDQ